MREGLPSLILCEYSALMGCCNEGLTVLLPLSHVLLLHVDESLSRVKALEGTLVVMGAGCGGPDIEILR